MFYDHAILLITLDIADHPHMADIGDRDPISVLCTTDCTLTREYGGNYRAKASVTKTVSAIVTTNGSEIIEVLQCHILLQPSQSKHISSILCVSMCHKQLKCIIMVLYYTSLPLEITHRTPIHGMPS